MKFNLKKLCIAGLLTAAAVSLSTFSIQIGASRCFPIQHIVNVIAAVFLGPIYGCCIAFTTSLLRNLLGTGSLLAFPGSMIGALLAGLLYQKMRSLSMAYIGEVFGTGILGALAAYPIAVFIMGKPAALYTYILPFIMSTVCGTVFAAFLLGILYKSKVMNGLTAMLDETNA